MSRWPERPPLDSPRVGHITASPLTIRSTGMNDHTESSQMSTEPGSTQAQAAITGNGKALPVMASPPSTSVCDRRVKRGSAVRGFCGLHRMQSRQLQRLSTARRTSS